MTEKSSFSNKDDLYRDVERVIARGPVLTIVVEEVPYKDGLGPLVRTWVNTTYALEKRQFSILEAIKSLMEIATEDYGMAFDVITMSSGPQSPSNYSQSPN